MPISDAEKIAAYDRTAEMICTRLREIRASRADLLTEQAREEHGEIIGLIRAGTMLGLSPNEMRLGRCVEGRFVAWHPRLWPEEAQHGR